MNIIEFSAPKNIEYFLKDVLPIPAKLNIPDWFKKLNHEFDNKTVKGCMPFLDALTAGYILKMPQDLFLRHNVLNKETKKLILFLNILFMEIREACTILMMKLLKYIQVTN